MASTTNLEITATSSSSSSLPITSWDVFLSFYGDDTRKNFTSHLYSALNDVGISTFRDDPALEKGQEISSGLLDAIRDSKMFVVVISENYARSSWCLNELVEILSYKKIEKQVVPVFYYVDPSDVRHQKGSFGDALDDHYQKKRYSPDTINKWRLALTQIAELSGYHLEKHANEYESETIQNIVENVARQVTTKALHLGEDLFGIDSAVEEIYEKLMLESNDVRAIGICGMGGIGKTTIAKAFYNKYSNTFESSCFIENVKQYSQGGSPLLPLLEQLLNALLRRKDCKVPDVDNGIRQLKQILCFKKTLIVLDDLDQSSYSEFLARNCNLFSAGSRIVITTRDVHLLNQLKIELIDVDIYMVKKLGEANSLELFNYYAFGKVAPPASLRELSVGFVTYAAGLPLALKVLGSSLRGRTQDEVFWKAKLEKVKTIPENKILEIFQLSYNELDDETVKLIFLDIAFFFVGKYQYEAFPIFKSCDYHPEVGIKILLERCLITIDEYDVFHMHDLIQDMGREISKSTRLFLRGNAWECLQELDKIEGLVLDLTQSTEKQINGQIFERLPKLRLLEIRDVQDIKGHFKNSFRELRCIYWSYCTWTQLPSSFRPQKLISIQMPFSNFRILWDDAWPFGSLKMINVEYSVNLKSTPNFGNSKSIERLYFRGCESLLKVHPSIRELTGLYVLDLKECIYAKDLAESLGQSSKLGYLYLGYCSNIRQLPKQLGGMKWLKVLDASYTAIEELPDSITQLKEMVYLELDGCRKLRKLPEQIGNMVGLRTFSASFTAIEQLPDSFIGLINLEKLDLSSCEKLRNLPNSIWKMQCLEELYVPSTAIEDVPDSVGLLSRLRLFNCSYCVNLKYLPESVWNLPSLTSLYLSQTAIDGIKMPVIVKDTKLVNLTMKCNIGVWLPVILIFFALKELILSIGSESSTKPFSLSKLYNLQYLELHNCTSFGSWFPELPLSITYLILSDHATLSHLPNLSSLKKLKLLEIHSYISLQTLPPLPPHLQSLKVHNCKSLQYLSDMSMLKELSDLQFGKSVGLKKSFLQVNERGRLTYGLWWAITRVMDVRNHFLPFYKVVAPKTAEWLSYTTTGRTFFFDIPTLSADNFLGLALTVLTSKISNNSFCIRADVINKTNGTTKSCRIPFSVPTTADEVTYVVMVKCIRGDEISIRSGDRIKIVLQRHLLDISGRGVYPYEGLKLEMLAAHLIPKTLSTPDFPSALNIYREFPYEGLKLEMLAVHLIPKALSIPDFSCVLNLYRKFLVLLDEFVAEIFPRAGRNRFDNLTRCLLILFVFGVVFSGSIGLYILFSFLFLIIRRLWRIWRT